MKCRVCGAEIKTNGWSSHCMKHKREFCRAIGRFEGEAWKINWEDVVLFYNPKLADRKKCINYPMKQQPKIKKLNEF